MSRSAVEDRIDPQNVFTAVKFFSLEVKGYMRDKQYNQTTDFIKITWDWFNAYNEQGIKADQRVEYLYNMHIFLLQQIKWNCFPMEVCDRYIKGMPIQTFESILQNISTRLQLYHASMDKTYNARSVSMLASESFFADIKH